MTYFRHEAPFILILFFPLVWQKVTVLLYWTFWIHPCDPVNDIRKVFEGVYTIKHAGQCQRVEHCPSPSSFVRNKE